MKASRYDSIKFHKMKNYNFELWKIAMLVERRRIYTNMSFINRWNHNGNSLISRKTLHTIFSESHRQFAGSMNAGIALNKLPKTQRVASSVQTDSLMKHFYFQVCRSENLLFPPLLARQLTTRSLKHFLFFLC